MSLRFTDTNKWEDQWFLDLTPPHRIIYLYLCDRCDCAGVWKLSIRDLCFRTGVTESDWRDFLCQNTGTRLWVSIEGAIDFVWLIKFIPFQYPRGLSGHNPTLRGVCRSLAKIQAPIELLPSPYQAPIKSLMFSLTEAPTKPLPSPTGQGLGQGLGQSVEEGVVELPPPNQKEDDANDLPAADFKEVNRLLAFGKEKFGEAALDATTEVSRANICELLARGYKPAQIEEVFRWATASHGKQGCPQSLKNATDSRFSQYLRTMENHATQIEQERKRRNK